MNREEVIATLKAHQSELMAIGILHAGLFGSVARGEQTVDSDIDILVDIDYDKIKGIYAFVAVQEEITSLFPGSVDVVSKGGIKDRFRSRIQRDLINVF
jgi:predicted nucleotidyltransferase